MNEDGECGHAIKVFIDSRTPETLCSNSQLDNQYLQPNHSRKKEAKGENRLNEKQLKHCQVMKNNEAKRKRAKI